MIYLYIYAGNRLPDFSENCSEILAFAAEYDWQTKTSETWSAIILDEDLGYERINSIINENQHAEYPIIIATDNEKSVSDAFHKLPEALTVSFIRKKWFQKTKCLKCLLEEILFRNRQIQPTLESARICAGSMSFLASLIPILPGILFTYRAGQQTIQIHNPSHMKKLGLPLNGEILNKVDILHLISPEDRKVISNMIQAMDTIKPGEIIRVKVQITNQNNRKMWLELISTPTVKDHKGRLAEMICLAVSSDEVKTPATNMNQFLLEWEKVLAQIPSTFCLIDETGIIRYTNRFANLAPEDVLGHNITEFFAGEEAAKLHKALHDVFCDMKALNYRSEYDVKGRKNYFENSVGPVKLDNGQKFAVYISDNITDEVEKEKHHAETEELLNLALTNVNEGLWEWNLVTQEIIFNAMNYHVLGYDDREFPSTFEELLKRVHPDDQKAMTDYLDTYLSTSHDQSNTIDLVYRFQAKDQSWHWINSRGKVVEKDKTGKARRLIGTNLDITEKKIVERNHLKEEEKLKRLLTMNSMVDDPESGIFDYALKSVVELTDSDIGYIYFYSEKTKDFTLHSWSAKVMDQCKIMEQQTIYHLDKTGIWGDVVRKRAPVLINDFQMPHPAKKGYPEGHVPIRRYLSIPVFDNNEIVAVTGVGNKADPYTLFDQEQLTGFMQGLWQVIQRHRTKAALVKTATAVEQSPESIMITDNHGNIEYVNPKFVELSGYSSEEVAGRNPRILQSGLTPRETYIDLWNTLLAGKIWRGEFYNRKKNGELYWESVSVSPIIDKQGQITNFIAVKEDITQKKEQELKLLKTLKEKEILLREIHHRVKNNMQVITSLLNLQETQNTKTNTAFDYHQMQKRIRSMALIHEKLYQSSDLSSILVEEYMNDLADELIRGYQSPGTVTHFSITSDKSALAMEYLLPLGLILTELITNSLKYAFTGKKTGQITLEFNRQPDFEDHYLFRYRDNGGTSFTPDFSGNKSLGLSLVDMMVLQLNGKLTWKHQNGMSYEISFTTEKLNQRLAEIEVPAQPDETENSGN